MAFKKGATPIAFEFHLTYNNVVYPIGQIMMIIQRVVTRSVPEYNIIKTLFGEGVVKEYNTCGHTYNYLMNWSEDTRKPVNIEIFCKIINPVFFGLEYKLIPLLRRLGAAKVKDPGYEVRDGEINMIRKLIKGLKIVLNDIRGLRSGRCVFIEVMPNAAILFLTYRCNSQCKTCGMWKLPAQETKNKEIAFAEWKIIIDKLCDAGIQGC